MALGPYPLSTHSAWHPFWDQDDAQDMVDDVPVAPIIWTDGSREPIPHLDVEVAGAGAFVHSPAVIFDSYHWGHAQDLDDPQEGSSHIFSRVLGTIQSVQRAEYWGVILALQAYSGVRIDNLTVLRGVAKLLSQGITGTPLPLVKDGDLPLFIPCFAFVAWIRLKSPRLRVMLLKPWLTMVMFVLGILLVTMALMQLLILGGYGNKMMSSLLDVTFFVATGTP